MIIKSSSNLFLETTILSKQL